METFFEHALIQIQIQIFGKWGCKGKRENALLNRFVNTTLFRLFKDAPGCSLLFMLCIIVNQKIKTMDGGCK